MSENASDFLTATEVAKWLCLKRSTIYVWAAKGRIPSLKLNGSVRFIRGDIQRWINDHVNRPADTCPSKGRSLVPHPPMSVSRLMIHRAGTRAIQRAKNSHIVEKRKSSW
jgi:excisionase family DNA binding protein